MDAPLPPVGERPTLMVRFACPSCNATLKAPEERAGARVNCPRCGQPLEVPAAPAAVEPHTHVRAAPPPPEPKPELPPAETAEKPRAKPKAAPKKRPRK